MALCSVAILTHYAITIFKYEDPNKKFLYSVVIVVVLVLVMVVVIIVMVTVMVMQ